MERPILFNSAMVKAILDGRKTQTRRVIKPQPEGRNVIYDPAIGWRFHGGPNIEQSPYGKPGDELWVRETWSILKVAPHRVCFKYDPQHPEGRSRKTLENGRWRPSIHMFRHLSRIQLRIKDVRVERVQDISERDAKAEGDKNPFEGHFHKDGTPIESSACLRFKTLWDSINAKRGYDWDANPWCWCITFEILDK